MMRFGVLFDLIPSGLTMTYWPGDDVFLVGKGNSCAKEALSDRSNKVIEFVRTPEFRTNVMVACVGSLPRWHFARSTNERAKDESEEDDGKRGYSAQWEILLKTLGR